MYLTDYREQTLKDVITEIEPELFRKVTGLTVKDFETLCSIGLFDSEKMNQGIFGFRRYENSSLNYTGIDKHAGESVGGWDTVLKRQEYEELYGKQQATMLSGEDLSNAVLAAAADIAHESVHARETTVEKAGGLDAEIVATDAQKRREDIELEKTLSKVKVGASVTHAKFGDGVITKITADNKYLRVKFTVGEKNFVFPMAFTQGFLKIKDT